MCCWQPYVSCLGPQLHLMSYFIQQWLFSPLVYLCTPLLWCYQCLAWYASQSPVGKVLWVHKMQLFALFHWCAIDILNLPMSSCRLISPDSPPRKAGAVTKDLYQWLSSVNFSLGCVNIFYPPCQIFSNYLENSHQCIKVPCMSPWLCHFYLLCPLIVKWGKAHTWLCSY